MNHHQPQPIVIPKIAGPSRSQEALKRALDILGALVGLFLTGWLLVLAYAAASIAVRGNGMFTQKRVGQGGRPFTILKLRTMRTVYGNTSTVTTADDERVTPLGAVLRKTKIDELPQLLNVLVGTMSLVGPRPTVEEDAARMDARQRGRFAVKPGITGLAQINGNTAMPWPKRIEYDLAYVREYSIMSDLRILARTIILVLSARVETHPASSDEWAD